MTIHENKGQLDTKIKGSFTHGKDQRMKRKLVYPVNT